MADRSNDGSPSSPLPSTSKGTSNRDLPSSSRRMSGSPPPRPSSSRGYNYRSWPSSSRGVTPRFRNFCITNEHPDGIVFCEPNGSVTAENERPAAAAQEDGASTNSPPPPPSSPMSSSSSSSPISSPTTSYCLLSSSDSQSSLSDHGTIILSSDDEDNSEFDKTESGAKASKKDRASKAEKQKGNGDNMPADENVNAEDPIGQPRPQPEAGHVAVGAVEGNEVPEYLHHKKFHYKQVQAAAAARSKELSVDNLRLSPYITKDQAESRLKALGDLQETQKEIDDFAAIICASNMYRLNLAKRNGDGKNIGRGRQPSLSTTNSGNQLPTIAELHEGRKKAFTSSIAGGTGTLGGGLAGYGAKASSSTATILQSTGTSAKNSSIGDGHKGRPPVAGKGSYLPAPPPGHVSSSDDYEWISDADD